MDIHISVGRKRVNSRVSGYGVRRCRSFHEVFRIWRLYDDSFVKGYGMTYTELHRIIQIPCCACF